MNNILVIDHGNTCAKIHVVTPAGERLCSLRERELSLERLAALIDELGAGSGVYSSVAGIDVRLVESLRVLLDGELLLLTAATPLPIALDYGSPRTLGADRIAAACGAAALLPGENVLVADAGTCLTLDLVARDHFIGGDIAPGVKMRLKAMAALTASLPEADKLGELPAFGTDTDTALRCGAVRGAAAQIADAFARARELHGVDHLILTGGDADLLAPCLPPHLNVITKPDLVTDGLLSILNYNEHL